MTPAADDASTGYPDLIANLRDPCVASGFDLLQPLQAGWYNECVDEKNRIADFADPESLVVLIGNTRRLWPALMATLQRRSDLLDCSDPLDAYVEETITAAVSALQRDYFLRWAHRPAPHHIAIQQMAEIAGLAWRSPASLSVHPVYGPWIALRAAVILPIPGPPKRPLPLPACESCPSACLRVLHDTPARGGSWANQLAVRDACPIGQQHRYPDQQIAYHYGKSKDQLRAAVNEQQPVQGA